MPAVSHDDKQVNVNQPIKHRYETPRLRFRIDDLSHSASSLFLKHIDASTDFAEQVQSVLNLLYRKDSVRPGTRSVTFILQKFEGVAYTTGIDLDNDHKEIHINLDFIKAVEGKGRHELLGVICHELVHCFQWNAQGTAPGGLIEGIADWVRLNANLAAGHWRRHADGKWDSGYERTGFFLDYVEKRFGAGTITKINEEMRDKRYDEEALWSTCCSGHSVAELWDDYRKALNEQPDHVAKDPSTPIPTHPASTSH